MADRKLLSPDRTKGKCFIMLHVTNLHVYEGDPKSNANPSVISSTFYISKNGLHVQYDIL